jgi:hypothetical protein
MATILYVGTAGNNDPTRHQAQIVLAGEAAYLMKDDVAAAVMPVAMPQAEGDVAGRRGSASSDLRLRQVLSGPWGHRGGSQDQGRAVHQLAADKVVSI